MPDMLSLHAIEMDLRKEARKVLSVFASEAKMKKIDLVLDFGNTLDMAQVNGIKCDPVRLGQVSSGVRVKLTSGSDELDIEWCGQPNCGADNSHTIYRGE